jgi:hypothetical protein
LANDGYYKFHDAAHTERLLSGEWLVSSLDYFSYTELQSGDQWIGDHTEPATIYKSDHPLRWSPSETPSEENYMRSEGLITRSGDVSGVVTIGAMTIRKAEWPAHIISLCHGEYAQCAHAMLEEPEPRYRYNACLEVSDAEAFGDALWEEGTTASGTPLRELFKRPLGEPVNYGDREADIHEQTPLQPGYFWKRRIYEKQKEFRIVFPHLEERTIRDRIVFRLPKPERFLSLKLSGVPSKSPQDPTPDLMEATKSLYARMREAKALHDTTRDHLRDSSLERQAETGRIWARGLSENATDADREALRQLQRATREQLMAESQHQSRFDEEYAVVLRDCLWRWRLEKHIRLRGDYPYFEQATMRHLEELLPAIHAAKTTGNIIHLRE